MRKGATDLEMSSFSPLTHDNVRQFVTETDCPTTPVYVPPVIDLVPTTDEFNRSAVEFNRQSSANAMKNIAGATPRENRILSLHDAVGAEEEAATLGRGMRARSASRPFSPESASQHVQPRRRRSQAEGTPGVSFDTYNSAHNNIPSSATDGMPLLSPSSFQTPSGSQNVAVVGAGVPQHVSEGQTIPPPILWQDFAEEPSRSACGNALFLNYFLVLVQSLSCK